VSEKGEGGKAFRARSGHQTGDVFIRGRKSPEKIIQKSWAGGGRGLDSCRALRGASGGAGEGCSKRVGERTARRVGSVKLRGMWPGTHPPHRFLGERGRKGERSLDTDEPGKVVKGSWGEILTNVGVVGVKNLFRKKAGGRHSWERGLANPLMWQSFKKRKKERGGILVLRELFLRGEGQGT